MNNSMWVSYVALIFLAPLSATIRPAVAEWPVSLRGCPEKCGNVSIPYPFGIGDKCSYHPNFTVTCNQSTQTPIYGSNLQVLDIDHLDGQVRITNYISRQCYNRTTGQSTYDYSYWIRLSKFTISPTHNILAAIGCDTYAYFTGIRSMNRSYITGCLTKCNSPNQIENSSCSGGGCCQTQIPKDVRYLSLRAYGFLNYTNTWMEFTPCSSAFAVAKDSFSFSLTNLTMNESQLPLALPVVYDWTIGDATCKVAKAKEACLCSDGRGSECIDSELGGYRCSCSSGYSGNPYLPHHGCRDINECESKNLNNCKEPATCVNRQGSYRCVCPEGFQGDGTSLHPCNPIENNKQTATKIILISGGSFIFFFILAFYLHWHHGQKQMMKKRDTFFQQNGGLLLHQGLSTRDASVEPVKIFTAKDLNKATNNYSENNIIGRGGHGMVYKGTLLNNQVVAIKKSLKVDSSQIEQFINEVLVLTQVNNRNVVRLLGCCLETEVPLLVYEFIENGTLHEHLHDERKGSLLSWDIRLRIVIEVAEVLAYLHTTVSTPIIHRDIKSMNILLDNNYVAKVSDFGASRLVPMDQEQVATMVLGTHGYLDPEYMQTGELNEKSDVYSFGVVLVEILTGRKAICFDMPENERCLAKFFLSKLEEESVLEIIDERIKSHGATLQFKEVANLSKRCLQLKGKDRPSMKKVAMELERIRRKDVYPWSSNVKTLREKNTILARRDT